jgi:protein-L-isoaspartate(D-aspartate) O-methyltransferase
MKRAISSLLFLIFCAVPLAVFADAWTFSAFGRAMIASGRNIGKLDEGIFQAVQARKPAMIANISNFLKNRLGKPDPLVIKAFREVPREYFMYNYQYDTSSAARAYETPAKDYDVGYGSTLSDYEVQAYMTQLVRPTPTDVCLEIGTGSGFQSALLSRIVKDVYSIEIITSLGEEVDKIYAPIGYNVHTRVGDGFYGWPEVNDGFDVIMVTCQAAFVPPPLLAQLKPNGRMVIPVGQPWRRQFLYLFTKDAEGKVHSKKEISVLFIPMTGRIQH